MADYLKMSSCIFPTPHIEATADYYEKVMGFRVEKYLEAAEPHICLYRDHVEIILTKANTEKVIPNRELYGYGYDAYLYTTAQEAIQKELIEQGAKIVRPLGTTDYQNKEFVVEDLDRRWIGFGNKQ